MLSNYVEHTKEKGGGGGGGSSSNTKMRDKRNKMLSRSIEKINMLVHIVWKREEEEKKIFFFFLLVRNPRSLILYVNKPSKRSS